MPYITRLLAVTFIAAGLAGPAAADAVISGPACIIDGNTLQVGGSMKDLQCWGGINVRLHGSVAPQLKETCTDSAGKTWNCGEKAKDALVKVVRRFSISCYHIDGEFQAGVPIVTCISGRRDLARELVVKGLAKALHGQSKRYEKDEEEAKEEKRGIWK